MTTNADTVASDGARSLREAVQAANTDAPVSDCPAGSGADQISLGATTCTLTAGQLDVTSELTITGTGAASTTIDGNHTGRVLNVTAAGKLTLDGVKGKCLKPSKKRHGKRCTRYVAVGSFRHADVAGANAFRWRGKVGAHKLTPGSYRLRAVPVAGLLAGKPLASSFPVVR